MFELKYMGCCGALEMNGLSMFSTPSNALREVGMRLRDWHWRIVEKKDKDFTDGPAFIVFTGVVKKAENDPDALMHCGSRNDNYGETFAKYLMDNGLGNVVSTEDTVSWTHNTLRMWVWTPDYARLWPFLRAEADREWIGSL